MGVRGRRGCPVESFFCALKSVALYLLIWFAEMLL